MHKTFSNLKGFLNFYFNGYGYISNHSSNGGSGDGYCNDYRNNDPGYGFGIGHCGEGDDINDFLYCRRCVCGDGSSYGYGRGYGREGTNINGNGVIDSKNLYIEETNA